MSIEAMKQALDALESDNPDIQLRAAITLRQAIEQAEQDPIGDAQAKLIAEQAQAVAWRTFDGEGGYDYRNYEENENYGEWWNQRHPKHQKWVEPLYTAPPQRKPLTDEEIRDLYGNNNNFDITGPYVIAFARAIEAAHGIKGKA